MLSERDRRLTSMRKFFSELDGLEWSPIGYVDPAIVPLLEYAGGDKRLLTRAVASWARSLDKRQLRCHETTTHYKWFVHYSDKFRYRVWLHQYKPQAARRLGHAEVPHNHRYSLASIVLRGGFVHHDYSFTDDGLIELAGNGRRFSQGDGYSVAWSQIHKLSDLKDGTLTLVVESPAVRHYSEAFYENETAPRQFSDFVGLHSRLIADVGSV